jgi:orotidine-5'-phosphate decarboxylase
MRWVGHMKDKSPIILALDHPDVDSVRALIERTQNSISIYKLGLEFYLAQGKAGIRTIIEEFPEIDIFLDLKLHDIPNTVAGAASSISDLAPRFLTVHAAGGGAMVSAAVKALPQTSITAVTVLTSLDQTELVKLDLPPDPEQLALSLARRAIEHGASSIVCSPHEASAIRREFGAKVTIITPGVRPDGSEKGDQNRVMTPHQALSQGANYVVIGRPISQASDPSTTAAEIRNSLL